MTKHALITIILHLCILVPSSAYANNNIDSLTNFINEGSYQQAQKLYNSISFQNLSEIEQVRLLCLGSQLDQINYNYAAALEKLIESREIAQNADYESYLNVSIELANFYTMQNKLDDALLIFADTEPSINTPLNTTCRFYHRKAFLYNQLNRLDSAILFSHDALTIARSNNFENATGTISNELANIYEKRLNIDSSLYYYNLSCEVYKDQLRYFSNSYFNLARLTLAQNEFHSAIEMFEDNLNQIDSTNWITLKSPIHFHLSEAYFAIGDSLNGLFHENIHVKMAVNIMQDDFNSDFQELNIKYKTDQKNIKIESQKRIIESEKERKKLWIYLAILAFFMAAISIIFFYQIKGKNKKLKKLMAENDFLMHESNHRIKNNLQLILSLVNRQLEKEDVNTQSISSIKSIAFQLETMADLHNQLYKHENIETVQLDQLIKDVVENFTHLLNQNSITLNLQVKEINIDLKNGLNIALLVNELMTNSLKYAFSNSNEVNQISIQIRKIKNELFFVFSDNGIGIKTKETPKLITLLLKQLKASFEFQNQTGMQLEFKMKTS